MLTDPVILSWTRRREPSGPFGTHDVYTGRYRRWEVQIRVYIMGGHSAAIFLGGQRKGDFPGYLPITRPVAELKAEATAFIDEFLSL